MTIKNLEVGWSRPNLALAMRPEEWSRVKEVFAAALPLSAEARAAFLARACGDDRSLLNQVQELLSSHQQATTFLESPPDLIEAVSARTLEGRRVGPYELSSRIGAGGMGDVYKAHDTRLNRIVAIKVLPAHVANDAVARDRFEREARAVAALNHPHICTLHDIGIHDGIDFLVLEYLDGETLASRLERGPLPLNHALQYAIQIASALDRVHRAGIVHRDLKPSNIILTKGGAKVLDFGLSKASPSRQTETDTRASSPEITSAGVILGTVQYMAPEQLDGSSADARSDIFAFGAVFYEMLSATKAFAANTQAAVMTAIREQEPPPLRSLPPVLDRIIRTCLAKDPDDRWQTARDLLRELKWAAEAAPSAIDATVSAQSRRSVIARIGGAIAIAGLLAGSWSFLFRDRAPDLHPVRFEISTPPTTDPMSFALSADGRHLAFVATSDGVSKLWVRPLDQLASRTLVGTDGASYPFWSPDGRSVGFFADGKLKRIDLAGGLAQVLADAPVGRGGTWSEAGIIVFAPSTATALMRVPATGGATTDATQLADGQNTHRWPHFLPGGRQFLYLSTLGKRGSQGVFLASIDNREATKILDDDAPAIFAPPDRLLVVRQSTLVAHHFDPGTKTVSGEPVAIAQPVGFDTVIARGAFTSSRNGIVAHRAAIAGLRQLAWADRTGKLHGTLGAADDNAIASPELSSDGLRVATFRTVDGNADLWVSGIGGGAPTRLTFHPRPEIFPLWSREGRRVVFTASRDGTFDLFEQAIDRDHEERLLYRSPYVKAPVDISPDGRLLVFATQVPQTGVDLWALPLEGGSSPFPVVQTPFDEMAGQVSPDGRSLAFQSNSSGSLEVYVRPFPGPGRAVRVSTGGGTQARWSRKGNELFYVAADNYMMAIPVRSSAGENDVEFGSPVRLFRTTLATGTNIPGAVGTKQQYAVGPDGRFLLNLSVTEATSLPITVTMNWQQQ